MPTKWETFPIKLTGGLVTNLGRLEHGLQSPGSATILTNFEPSVNTGYSRILGYNKFSQSVVPGTGDIVGVVAIENSKCLVYRDAKYYVSLGAAYTQITATPTPGSPRLRYDTFNWDGTEKWVLVDEINKPAIYDPTADTITYDNAAPEDATSAKLVKVFKNHIFFAKNNLLSFTVPYTTNNWATGSGAGVINVGQNITGLAVFRDQLIIFTNNTIQYLIGNTSTDFQLLLS